MYMYQTIKWTNIAVLYVTAPGQNELIIMIRDAM